MFNTSAPSMYGLMVLFSLGALVAASSSGRVDPSSVDFEHWCVGSRTSGKRATTATKSTVRVRHMVRLMTRALHRIDELKNTYVSQRLHSENICRMLEETFPITMPDLHPNLDAATDVRHKVDDTLRQLMTALMTHIVYVNHVRRDELYWAGDNPNQMAFRETTYHEDVAELHGNALMPIACSIKQMMSSHGVSVDASALQRMKEIEYTSPLSQYLGDMQAYVVFNSLRILISKSREFIKVVTQAGLL